MAGHSKWANIQHRKGRQDDKRGRIWTRITREIIVAARAGGADVNMNPRLRLAIEKAKAANMPADNIKRNVDKATGNLDGVTYEEIRYEGYGIGGAAIIVDCMTDNRVRTVADVRHAFSKYGGNMGTEGSVAFQFQHVGQFLFAPGVSEDKVMEVALEAGAEDVITHEDGSVEVLSAPPDFEAVKAALEGAGLQAEMAEVTMRAENTIELSGDDAARMQKLLDVLEDLDDVQEVYPNAELSELREQGPRMNILVIGSGGREHALAWKLAQSPKAGKVYVAPGNGGTARDARLVNVPITDIQALADFAQANKIVLTVVGPEAPLAAGVVDEFRARGLRIFGPTQKAAQLESSKAFAKDFMKRHGIPTAFYETFTDTEAAHAFVDKHGAPIVIKADGLAAGKGVVVAMTLEEAHQAVDWMLLDNALGVQHNAGGARVVIEEFLAGEEASFIVMSDGKNVSVLATSQDHKRLLDGDEGPNTGGMGAYSPAPVVTPNVYAKAMQEIIQPTLAGMAKDGVPFTGFLYAGLMIDAQGNPKTLEFNCRMGDPETQPIMMRLKSDLIDVFLHATDGTLDQVELEWDRRVALGVVLAAADYPLNPRKGDVITGLPAEADDAMVFHAGTTMGEDGQVRTSGGRVLCVTALGDSAKLAQQRAYDYMRGIQFDGMQFRTDIGWRAIKAR